MTPEDVRLLYDYNYWAADRMMGVVERLPPEEFLRDLGNSFPSIRDTVVHMMGAEWIWLCRWRGESPQAMLPAADFPTAAAVRARWDDVERQVRAFVGSLSAERLAQVLAYRSTQGQALAFPLGQMLQHVVNHGTYHRGQVTTMVRQLGVRPAATDFSLFAHERAAGR